MSRKVIEIVQFRDDLDGSELTEGDAVTTNVAFEGEGAELDLSMENYEKVRAFMRRLLDSGRKADPGARPPRQPKPANPVTSDYNENLRLWCREFNIKNKAGNGWGYETNSGTNQTYYPAWLHKQYAAWLAEQDTPSFKVWRNQRPEQEALVG